MRGTQRMKFLIALLIAAFLLPASALGDSAIVVPEAIDVGYHRYIEYTPGEPVTITLPVAPSSEKGTIHYRWCLWDEEEDKETVLSEGEDQVQLTHVFSKADDGNIMRVHLSLTPDFEGNDVCSYPTDFILLDETKGWPHPPQEEAPYFRDICIVGESGVRVSLPEAQTGTAGKRITYCWYGEYGDGWSNQILQSDQPVMEISAGMNDANNPLVGMWCQYGNAGEGYPLEYNTYFRVEFLDAQRAIVEKAFTPSELDEISNVAQREFESTQALDAYMRGQLEIQSGIQLGGLSSDTALSGAKLYDVEINAGVTEHAVLVSLPYPEGTNAEDYDFVVAHLMMSGERAGEIEYPAVTETEDGLQFTLTGLSPVMMAWKAEVNAVDIPLMGDETPLAAYALLALSFVGALIWLARRRT